MSARKRTNAGAGAKSKSQKAPAGAAAGKDNSSRPADSQQKNRSIPSGLRGVLALVSLLCFAYVLYSQLGRYTSSTPQQDQSAAPPAAHKQQPSKSAAELAAEREKIMKQINEEFEKWTPAPSLPFFSPPRQTPTNPQRTADVDKREAVKGALKSSWAAYVHDAWGSDEYHPISHTGSNLSTDGGMGYTIVDSLDTLLIAGEQDEYNRARDWVKHNLAGGMQSWERRGRFNVFETVIRTLGGLLSAHALCTEHPSNIESITSPYWKMCDPGDAPMYLEAAQHLANQLHPAFDTPTGVPKREVDFYTGQAYADADNNGAASLAEATTVQMEFKYLSFLTQDGGLWKMAERPMKAVRDATRGGAQDGLLPIFISPETGQFYMSPIRLGSRGDSYYEYLIKQYVQTNRSEAVYRDMYDRAVSGIKKHLVKQSTHSRPPYLFTAEIIPEMQLQKQQRPAFRLLPKQDHLVCFLGGAMMLGAHDYGAPTSGWPVLSTQAQREGRPTTREEDWAVGHEMVRGCMATYQETSTGLAPEIAHWRTKLDKEHEEEDWYIKQAQPDANTGRAPEPLIDARNILRPETVESLYVAFHLSGGDPIYRQWGWEIFQAFEKYCRLPNGAYAGIKDVDPDTVDGDEGPDALAAVEHEDKMETFWISETLKYLYLLFDDLDGPNALRLDQWVLNTEAHPLPVFQPEQPTGFK